MMVGCDWCILILIVPARTCSPSGPLLYHSSVVFLDCTNCIGNFNSAVPVDIIRVKNNQSLLCCFYNALVT